MATTSPSRIAELSGVIQSNVAVIDAYFSSNALPAPSFDQDYPTNLRKEIHEARNAVLVATDELTDLMLGPQQIAECHPPQHTSLIGIQAIYRWNIADKLGDEEEISFKDLSERCGVPESDFTQVLRQAMSKHIFKESRKGIVAHNAASKLYKQDSGLKEFISVALDDIWPSATRMLDAMEKWNFSQESNKTGFNLFEGSEDAYLSTMRTNAKRRNAFSKVMSYMQSRPGFGSSLSELVSAFDWNLAGKVVDIGGGFGDTSLAILRNTSATQCVVQDLPDVVAEVNVNEVAGEHSDRITFMGHDFFQEQPIKDADVYFLRWVLHDWSDESATKILRQLKPALKPGSNILIQEFIVPPSGQVPSYYEKTIRCMDLAMKATFNSKERDIEAWIALFANADPGFYFVDAKMGSGHNLAVLHFTWNATN